MNTNVVKRIIEDWELAAPPAKPGPDRIERYRRLLPRNRAWSVFVLGVTPEILDMLITAGASRVVAMDIHAETMEAMRHFAREDWGRVELTIGDWCVRRPGLEAGFDVAISDGGPLFLPFPDVWRKLFGVLFDYLVPGGRALIGHFAVPQPPPDFRPLCRQILDRFDRESRGLPPEAQIAGFKSAVAVARLSSFYGAVDESGTVQADRAAVNFKTMLDDLTSRYPEGPMQRVLQAMFFRPNPIGDEGLGLVSMPGMSRVLPLLESLGYQNVGMHRLRERPEPGIAMIIEASKPKPG
jgi:SAM-dependent methyltransferase